MCPLMPIAMFRRTDSRTIATIKIPRTTTTTTEEEEGEYEKCPSFKRIVKRAWECCWAVPVPARVWGESHYRRRHRGIRLVLIIISIMLFLIINISILGRPFLFKMGGFGGCDFFVCERRETRCGGSAFELGRGARVPKAVVRGSG